MPHHAKPFFRTGRGWYVQFGKQQIKLCDGPQNSDTEAAAWARYHLVMAEQAVAPAAPNTFRSADGPTVAEVFDKYLDWCQQHRAERTYEWYRDRIQDFINRKPGVARLLAADLRPFHVVEWADSHGEDWSAAYRRGAIVAIQRPFNWAQELGYIAASPIKKIKKPQPQRRESHITQEDFAAIAGRYAEGDPFRDLLEFAWYSGCRPQEARHIEARHVRLEAECVVIPKDEAKGKRRPRVILLHGQELEIIKRLVARHPSGKLFRNEDGRPWKRFAIANRFDRLHLALGIQALKEAGIAIPPLPRFNRWAYADKAALAAARKEHQQKLRERRKAILKLARQHGKKVALYDARHGFAQRMLESGANHLAVAELMGHSTGRMVAETYSHMNRATDHLKEALKRADEDASGG
jgi:integrase